jgi:hypothetical protein
MYFASLIIEKLFLKVYFLFPIKEKNVPKKNPKALEIEILKIIVFKLT